MSSPGCGFPYCGGVDCPCTKAAPPAPAAPREPKPLTAWQEYELAMAKHRALHPVADDRARSFTEYSEFAAGVRQEGVL